MNRFWTLWLLLGACKKSAPAPVPLPAPPPADQSAFAKHVRSSLTPNACDAAIFVLPDDIQLETFEGPKPPLMVNLAIPASGPVWVDNEEVELEELRTVLARRFDNAKSLAKRIGTPLSSGAELEIAVAADGATAGARLAEALEACRKARFKAVHLVGRSATDRVPPPYRDTEFAAMLVKVPPEERTWDGVAELNRRAAGDRRASEVLSCAGLGDAIAAAQLGPHEPCSQTVDGETHHYANCPVQDGSTRCSRVTEALVEHLPSCPPEDHDAILTYWQVKYRPPKRVLTTRRMRLANGGEPFEVGADEPWSAIVRRIPEGAELDWVVAR